MGRSCAVAGAFVFLFSLAARADQPPPEAARARGEIESTIAAMRGRAQWVRSLLRDARRRGTPAQIACLDDALSRADVAVRRAREHGDASLAAYAEGNVVAAREQCTHVALHRLAQEIAARDALACAPPQRASSTTTVKVDVDPKIPKTD
jgi:hypothetical protein